MPHDVEHLTAILTALAANLVVGLAITRVPSIRLARGAAWALVLGGALGIEYLTAEEPPGLRMLALIGMLLTGLKAVVSVEARAAGGPVLTSLQWFGFAGFWLGMRPAPFVSMGGPPLPGARTLFTQGLVGIAWGTSLLAAARWFWIDPPSDWSEPVVQVLATILLLPGLSLILHFGLCKWMAGAWRLMGVDCRNLFRAPLRARSLTEFWGRRWNLAFSEMAALAVYRPLAGRLGKGAATMAVFLFSGLLHEAAISVPVRAGFGLPLLYFTLHGGLVLVERRLAQLKRPIESWGWMAHLWTLGWLALPLPILFHPFFLRGVVWPILGVEG